MTQAEPTSNARPCKRHDSLTHDRVNVAGDKSQVVPYPLP
jgi:hypothetical protein